MSKRISTQTIIILSAICIVAVFLFITLLVKNEQTFFRRVHFADWAIDYPETEEILKYKSERAFGNDHDDYIIFPSDVNVKNEIERFLSENRNLIRSEGDEEDQTYSPPYPISFFYASSDDTSLEQRIGAYEGYHYWILEKTNGYEKLGILTSESEVIFLFMAL